MLLGNYVFHMKIEEIIIILVQAAVLTAVGCPLPDEGPERGIHQSPGELARS
jgi:hypothetical protein